MTESKNNHLYSLIFCGCCLAVASAQARGLFGGGSPSIFAPSPIPLFLVWLSGIPSYMAVLVAPVLFLSFSNQLFKDVLRIPRRTQLLTGLVGVLSVVWFCLGWRYGIQYEGLRYTITAAVLSGTFGIAMVIMLVRSHQRPSWPLALGSHVLLFLWLITYAFPYLGETP